MFFLKKLRLKYALRVFFIQNFYPSFYPIPFPQKLMLFSTGSRSCATLFYFFFNNNYYCCLYAQSKDGFCGFHFLFLFSTETYSFYPYNNNNSINNTISKCYVIIIGNVFDQLPKIIKHHQGTL